MPLTVEIWSDIVCPWCYIGKRRFEAALEAFEHRDEVTVMWRSFELDPAAPSAVEGTATERLATKYGMSLERAEGLHRDMTERAAAEGLDFRFDLAQSGNTFDAHRLIHLAATYGHQSAAKERLMRAYFTEGAAISDPETLIALMAEVGVDVDEARDVLSGDRFAEDVREDEQLAGQLGIQGVPFFVIDRRFGVSGAQPPEALVQALERAWGEAISGESRGAAASPG
jgi:predicted DsbA family dithiol-disulfide isomerase